MNYRQKANLNPELKEVEMKFALETLPLIIGEEDYLDLCRVLNWCETDNAEISGAEFAKYVREKAFQKKYDFRLSRANEQDASNG